MATTTPREWSGHATCDTDKIDQIKEVYVSALGDSDKAGEVDTEAYYSGWHEALAFVLDLLYDMPYCKHCGRPIREVEGEWTDFDYDRHECDDALVHEPKEN